MQPLQDPRFSLFWSREKGSTLTSQQLRLVPPPSLAADRLTVIRNVSMTSSSAPIADVRRKPRAFARPLPWQGLHSRALCRVLAPDGIFFLVGGVFHGRWNADMLEDLLSRCSVAANLHPGIGSLY